MNIFNFFISNNKHNLVLYGMGIRLPGIFVCPVKFRLWNALLKFSVLFTVSLTALLTLAALSENPSDLVLILSSDRRLFYLWYAQSHMKLEKKQAQH